MRYDGKKHKRRFKKLRIDEISLVDRPAHSEARIALMKRMALTTSADNHTHKLILVAAGGESFADLRSGSTSYVEGHMHDWVMDEAGNITLTEADGHTHDIATMIKKLPDGFGKNQSEAGNNMTPEEEKLALEKARADRAESIVKLSADERAYFDALPASEQDAFLANDDKAAVVKNAAEADPVVYTSLDGKEFRKSVGETVLDLVKSNDELRKRDMQREAVMKRESFVKSAGEVLGHVSGSIEAKADLMEAVDSLPVEKQEAVLEILKSKDAGLARAFEEVGNTGAGNACDAETKLQAIAKGLRDNDSSLTPERAYSAALDTPEGRELYSQLN